MAEAPEPGELSTQEEYFRTRVHGVLENAYAATKPYDIWKEMGLPALIEDDRRKLKKQAKLAHHDLRDLLDEEPLAERLLISTCMVFDLRTQDEAAELLKLTTSGLGGLARYDGSAARKADPSQMLVAVQVVDRLHSWFEAYPPEVGLTEPKVDSFAAAP